MSLISFRNLVAPMSNKVHLVTVILVALAFGVLRLSGGTVETHSTNKSSNPTKKVHQDRRLNLDEDMNLNSLLKQPAIDFNSLSPKTDVQNLGATPYRGSLPEAKAPSAPPSRPKAVVKDDSQSSLDDIERSLGLK